MLKNVFFTPQFNYCLVIWMFHSLALDNKINSLHERCLRIIYNDKTSTFEKLLEKDNPVSIHSQFNYCLVIWIFYSRALDNKINSLHERCLRIIYNDKTSTFKKLLEKDNPVSIHYSNIQALAIEMYKVANGMSPEIMNEIFQLREKSHYNLRYTSEFIIPPIHSVYHGSESVSYLGPKIWELNPPVIRQIDTFS